MQPEVLHPTAVSSWVPLSMLALFPKKPPQLSHPQVPYDYPKAFGSLAWYLPAPTSGAWRVIARRLGRTGQEKAGVHCTPEFPP